MKKVQQRKLWLGWTKLKLLPGDYSSFWLFTLLIADLMLELFQSLLLLLFKFTNVSIYCRLLLSYLTFQWKELARQFGLSAVIENDESYDMVIRRYYVLSDALKNVGRLSFDPTL